MEAALRPPLEPGQSDSAPSTSASVKTAPPAILESRHRSPSPVPRKRHKKQPAERSKSSSGTVYCCQSSQFNAQTATEQNSVGVRKLLVFVRPEFRYQGHQIILLSLEQRDSHSSNAPAAALEITTQKHSLKALMLVASDC
ncbi:hypothetical protein UY3_12538 [Chelonia mydas]|uniref:Uncharacterized protein n=1 Tax=Chelonia mydas TaxID=8469 RepID=M7B4B9_CHEMY|nr:hypothetical protein UY3_12538 [Chelonia mydas]